VDPRGARALRADIALSTSEIVAAGALLEPVEATPSDFATTLMRASTLIYRGARGSTDPESRADLEHALALMERAGPLLPETTWRSDQLFAQIHFAAGRPAEALPFAEKVLHHKPAEFVEDPALGADMAGLAALAAALAHSPKTADLVRDAIAASEAERAHHGPGSSDAYLARALLLARQGDTEAARADLKQVHTLGAEARSRGSIATSIAAVEEALRAAEAKR
jgi:tetratricopeptide (TPR) repeat protein